MCSFKRRFNKNHHYFITIVLIKRHPTPRTVELNNITGMKKSMTVLSNTTTTTITNAVFSPPTPLIPIIPNVEGPYLSSATSNVFINKELNQSTVAASTVTSSLSVNGTGDEINSFYFYEVSILEQGLFHFVYPFNGL